MQDLVPCKVQNYISWYLLLPIFPPKKYCLWDWPQSWEFALVALFNRATGAIRSCCSLQKEWIAPVAPFKRAKERKERKSHSLFLRRGALKRKLQIRSLHPAFPLFMPKKNERPNCSRHYLKRTKRALYSFKRANCSFALSLSKQVIRRKKQRANSQPWTVL